MIKKGRKIKIIIGKVFAVYVFVEQFNTLQRTGDADLRF